MLLYRVSRLRGAPFKTDVEMFSIFKAGLIRRFIYYFAVLTHEKEV